MAFFLRVAFHENGYTQNNMPHIPSLLRCYLKRQKRNAAQLAGRRDYATRRMTRGDFGRPHVHAQKALHTTRTTDSASSATHYYCRCDLLILIHGLLRFVGGYLIANTRRARAFHKSTIHQQVSGKLVCASPLVVGPTQLLDRGLKAHSAYVL